MSRVAVLIDDWFEDSEYSEPCEAFKEAGHTLVHVGLKKNKIVKGKKKGTVVRIDESVADVSAEDFEALLIPGGYSPDKLRAHDGPVEFVKEFMESGKPVFAICHGPQLLITAKKLAGRKATGWKSIKQDMLNAGAEYIDAQVVDDGNLVSSRMPADLPAFIKASLMKLRKKN